MTVTTPVIEVDEERLRLGSHLARSGRIFYGARRVRVNDHPASPRLRVNHAGSSGLRATIECNPSRLVAPDAASLASVSEGMQALFEHWRDVHQWVTPAVHLLDANVRQIDVAVDFTDVLDPGRFLRALPPIVDTAPRGEVSMRYGSSAPRYVAVGSKTGGHVALYDKQYETRRKRVETDATLRAEVRGSGWLERARLTRLGDLTDGTAAGFFWERWKWSRMGTEIASGHDIIARLDEACTEENVNVNTALATMVRMQSGVEPAVSDNTLRKCLKVFDRIGVANWNLHMPDDHVPFNTRLDPVSRTAIVSSPTK